MRSESFRVATAVNELLDIRLFDFFHYQAKHTMVGSTLQTVARPALRAARAGNALRCTSGTAQNTFIRRKATLPGLLSGYELPDLH